MNPVYVTSLILLNCSSSYVSRLGLFASFGSETATIFGLVDIICFVTNDKLAYLITEASRRRKEIRYKKVRN